MNELEKLFYFKKGRDGQMSRRTKLGVKFAGDMVTYDTLKLAIFAEKLGYYSLWTTESRFTRDAVTRISAIAALSKKVMVGTAVINPFTRSPALLAITSATIDEISNGRFILGLGAGTKKYLSCQGLPFIKPLKRLEECTILLRKLWRGEFVSFKGETLEVSDVRLDFKPVRERIPIYFGVTSEKGIKLAMDIGDGIILNGYTSVSYAERANKRVKFHPRGKKLPVLGNVMVAMDDDEDKAIDGAKPFVYTYITSFPAIAKANLISREFIEELKEIEAKRSIKDALEQLPDKMVKEVVAVGTPEDCRKWITEYLRVGLEEVLITPIYGNAEKIVKGMSELLN